MVELLVMRHAKSDWSSPHLADFDRPLAPRGHRAASRMAEWLHERDLIPDRVVSSAAVRARQTAEHVERGLALEPSAIEFVEDLYLASSERWMEELRVQHENHVLIVGHNPGFDDLVETLSGRAVATNADGKLMTTAAVAHFEFEGPWEEIDVGTCRLLQLVRPREL